MAVAQVGLPNALHLAGEAAAGWLNTAAGAPTPPPLPFPVFLTQPPNHVQIAFVIIIIITLIFDAVVESGVKTILLEEPFTCDAALLQRAARPSRGNLLLSGCLSFPAD